MEDYYNVEFHSAYSRPGQVKSIFSQSGLVWGPPRLVLGNKVLDLVYMHPGGMRTAMAKFLFGKVSFQKHPCVRSLLYILYELKFQDY